VRTRVFAKPLFRMATPPPVELAMLFATVEWDTFTTLRPTNNPPPSVAVLLTSRELWMEAELKLSTLTPPPLFAPQSTPTPSPPHVHV